MRDDPRALIRLRNEQFFTREGAHLPPSLQRPGHETYATKAGGLLTQLRGHNAYHGPLHSAGVPLLTTRSASAISCAAVAALQDSIKGALVRKGSIGPLPLAELVVAAQR